MPPRLRRHLCAVLLLAPCLAGPIYYNGRPAALPSSYESRSSFVLPQQYGSVAVEQSRLSASRSASMQAPSSGTSTQRFVPSSHHVPQMSGASVWSRGFNASEHGGTRNPESSQGSKRAWQQPTGDILGLDRAGSPSSHTSTLSSKRPRWEQNIPSPGPPPLAGQRSPLARHDPDPASPRPVDSTGPAPTFEASPTRAPSNEDAGQVGAASHSRDSSSDSWIDPFPTDDEAEEEEVGGPVPALHSHVKQPPIDNRWEDSGLAPLPSSAYAPSRPGPAPAPSLPRVSRPPPRRLGDDSDEEDHRPSSSAALNTRIPTGAALLDSSRTILPHSASVAALRPLPSSAPPWPASSPVTPAAVVTSFRHVKQESRRVSTSVIQGHQYQSPTASGFTSRDPIYIPDEQRAPPPSFKFDDFKRLYPLRKTDFSDVSGLMVNYKTPSYGELELSYATAKGCELPWADWTRDKHSVRSSLLWCGPDPYARSSCGSARSRRSTPTSASCGPTRLTEIGIVSTSSEGSVSSSPHRRCRRGTLIFSGRSVASRWAPSSVTCGRRSNTATVSLLSASRRHAALRVERSRN